VYFNANFSVFFKLIKVHLLMSELYIHRNAQCNDKKKSGCSVVMDIIPKIPHSQPDTIRLCRLHFLINRSTKFSLTQLYCTNNLREHSYMFRFI